MHSIDLENGEPFTGIEDASGSVSLAVTSPYGGECSLALSGPVGADASLRVYDVSGRLVASLFEGQLPEGVETVLWSGVDGSGRRVASGVYFALVESAGVTQTAKLVYIR